MYIFTNQCKINRFVTGMHIMPIHARIYCFPFVGVKTIFAGSSCNDLVTIHGTNIVSGHFDKRVRFWDSRVDSNTNEILLQGRLTSLDLSPGTIVLIATCILFSV